MRKQAHGSRCEKTKRFYWRQTLSVSRNTLIFLVLMISCSVLLYPYAPVPGFANSRQAHVLRAVTTRHTVETVAINGADRWDEDTEVTAASFDFALASAQGLAVAPPFVSYYNGHAGTQRLGAPLTTAFPISQGWMQFFEFGALLLPAVQTGGMNRFRFLEDPFVSLIAAGTRDAASGIVLLPLLPMLLTVGSEATVDNSDGSLNFVELRQAASPEAMVPDPLAAHAGQSDDAISVSALREQRIFIKEGTRAGEDVGHLIPRVFWNYINRSANASDGWETDFGVPLTEALAFTAMKNDGVHQMLVQAFQHDALILDQTTSAGDQAQVQRIESGLAYLRTLGAPAIAIKALQPVWTQGDTALFDAPGTGNTAVHLGQQFPLTLTGGTAWNKNMLWYHVRWQATKQAHSAWVTATDVTFASPGEVPGWASLDALSAQLAAYLADSGDSVGVAVYDVTRQRYYTSNADTPFIVASSMKVPIMLAFLDMVEHQGREPDDGEMSLLTTMIENSNNDSASALYDEINDAAGMNAFLQEIGVTGLQPQDGSWGYSLMTPLTMVNLLTLLYTGKILTPQDRALAFSLMEQVQPDQQVGIGDTAPDGATVALKDGWVPGPDGLWAMNSSGIVTAGQETYIIAVYTQEQDSLDAGQAISRYVCGAVAGLLV